MAAVLSNLRGDVRSLPTKSYCIFYQVFTVSLESSFLYNDSKFTEYVFLMHLYQNNTETGR